MTWTTDEKLKHLLTLPWTIVREQAPEGEVVLRVAEIPSATGTGTTDSARETDLWDSLRESLRALLHFNDPVPLPQGSVLPWAASAPVRGRAVPQLLVTRGRQQEFAGTPAIEPDPTAAIAPWLLPRPNPA